MAINKFVRNPFYTSIEMPDRYFCDRETETAEMIRLLTNGNNIVLKAPRRTGKSSLIKHILNQKVISENYNTMYVDIMGTTNADGFVRSFQNEIFRHRFAFPAKALKTAREIAAHISIEPSYDMTTNMILPKIGLNPIRNIEMNLDALFKILRDTDRPNIVVLDEFQQIEEYPEKMTAILRSHIQQCQNTKFIFSGSEPHMLVSIFQDRNKPFYDSAKPITLDIIAREIYTDFCIKQFRDFHKDIKRETADFVYNLFCGKTYCLQETMNNLFSLTDKNETADTELALQVIEQSLECREQDFRDLLSRFPGTKEQRLLFCVANEGVATGILSTDMIKKYQLDSPSSVQNAIGNLTNNPKNKKSKYNTQGVVCEIAPNTNAYKLNDKYFELWLVRELPSYRYKIENAEMLFEAERDILKASPYKNMPKCLQRQQNKS